MTRCHTLLQQSDSFQRLDDCLHTHTPDGPGSFRGVLKMNTDSNLSMYMILWDFLGQMNSEPFSEITSGTS